MGVGNGGGRGVGLRVVEVRGGGVKGHGEVKGHGVMGHAGEGSWGQWWLS